MLIDFKTFVQMHFIHNWNYYCMVDVSTTFNDFFLISLVTTTIESQQSHGRFLLLQTKFISSILYVSMQTFISSKFQWLFIIYILKNVCIHLISSHIYTIFNVNTTFLFTQNGAFTYVATNDIKAILLHLYIIISLNISEKINKNHSKGRIEND